MYAMVTKSKYPTGKIITWGTGSKSSHFALLIFDSVVLHCNFTGLHFMPKEKFFKTCDIIDSVQIPMSEVSEMEYVRDILKNYYGMRYDWKYFFGLAWYGFLYKAFGKPMPEKIKWNSRAKWICTELGSTLGVDEGNGLPDVMISNLRKALYGNIS